MSNKGQSLVQVMVGVGILGIITLAFAEFVRHQQRELKAIQQKQELTELKSTLLQMFASTSICSWQLSANSTTGVPNQIDATNISGVATDQAVSINIPKLYFGTSTASQVVVSSELNSNKLAGSQTNLRVQSIKLKDIFATGTTDEYRGSIEVTLDPESLIRSLKPVQAQVIFKVTPLSAMNPISVRKILSCGIGVSNGQVLQRVSYEQGAFKLGTVVATYAPSSMSNQMIFNNTAPEITDGDEFMQLSITPKSAMSKIILQANVNLGFDGAGHIIAAAFEEGTSNALASAVGSVGQGNVQMVNLSLNVEYTNTDLNSKMFSIRAGGDVTQGFQASDANPGSHKIFFNGAAGTGKLGGTIKSSITLIEVDN